MVQKIKCSKLQNRLQSMAQKQMQKNAQTRQHAAGKDNAINFLSSILKKIIFNPSASMYAAHKNSAALLTLTLPIIILLCKKILVSL